jgi:hypothetical protein
MTARSIADLTGLVALVAAISLYGMLSVMALQERGYSLRRRAAARDGLPLVTALLGLAWNLGALALARLGPADIGAFPGVLIALAYAALGFLPAVFVHAALRSLGVVAESGLVQGLRAAGYARARRTR